MKTYDAWKFKKKIEKVLDEEIEHLKYIHKWNSIGTSTFVIQSFNFLKLTQSDIWFQSFSSLIFLLMIAFNLHQNQAKNDEHAFFIETSYARNMYACQIVSVENLPKVKIKGELQAPEATIAF